MLVLWGIVALFLTVEPIGEGWAEDTLGVRPLLTIAPKDLHRILPPDSHILVDPRSIEQFLMHSIQAHRTGAWYMAMATITLNVTNDYSG